MMELLLIPLGRRAKESTLQPIRFYTESSMVERLQQLLLLTHFCCTRVKMFLPVFITASHRPPVNVNIAIYAASCSHTFTVSVSKSLQ